MTGKDIINCVANENIRIMINKIVRLAKEACADESRMKECANKNIAKLREIVTSGGEVCVTTDELVKYFNEHKNKFDFTACGCFLAHEVGIGPKRFINTPRHHTITRMMLPVAVFATSDVITDAVTCLGSDGTLIEIFVPSRYNGEVSFPTV